MSDIMLEIKDLHVHYGGIHAVKGVSLSIPRGSIVTLIGANGAGKSSVIRSVAGLVKGATGEVILTRRAGCGCPTHSRRSGRRRAGLRP